MELFSQTCFTYLYWSVPGAFRLKNTSHMFAVISEKLGVDDRNGSMESDQRMLGLSVKARIECLFNYVILDYFVCLACVTLKNKIEIIVLFQIMTAVNALMKDLDSKIHNP